MSYTNVYPSRINWENEPSIASPLNATNLNKLDYAAYEFDQTFATWDITKANQSDLLLSVKSIDYDTETGVFVFTWQNGTTKTVDLNIEKIPVSFSMSPQGVITMTTDDGTTYTADVGGLIKTYTFSDSTEIDFTVTTDASGNKTVTAALKDGSIVGTKLEPNYLANCQSAANSASASKTAAEGSAEDSEAWAVGTRDGVPVPNTDPAYNNNSKYWAEHTTNSFAGLTDTDITNPQDGQVPVYNSSSNKWENADPEAGGGSSIMVMTSESALYGRSVTLTLGGYTKTETFSNVGIANFKGVTATGTFTITSSTSGGDTATTTLYAPYFGNYIKQLTLFSATVTITYPRTEGATCTISDGVTTLTANTSPMAFDIPNSGTWVATCTLDGLAQTESFTITTDGQTESHTFTYGTINLTYDNEFRGLSLTCTDSSYTITKTAPSTGNTMVFYPNETNTWTISGTYSGVTYTTTAEVSSLSTPVSAILQTIPDGSTVTPTDAIQTWLKCAAINDKSYTTLNEVLADTDTFTALLQDSNACDYMARSTTWSTTICADADAMARVGKYDYCSYVLRNNNTWNTAITNSPYSSYIPASPTGQTNIIHSAASDTLYYIDGSNQTIGTTDTSGVGTVDWSNVPVGNLTIYSSVANEPDDLTSAYSKTVRITPNTVEVYVMPDNALYWYGYQSASIENASTANGWSYSTYTFSAPSYETYYINISSSGTTYSGVSTKQKVSSGKVAKTICQGVTVYQNIYGSLFAIPTKDFTSQSRIMINDESADIAVKQATLTADAYVSVGLATVRAFKVYALWYE